MKRVLYYVLHVFRTSLGTFLEIFIFNFCAFCLLDVPFYFGIGVIRYCILLFVFCMSKSIGSCTFKEYVKFF